MALKICELFRDLVNQGPAKWVDARQLFVSARKLGKKLSEADKMNFTVSNVVKRIYHIIREECH
jgi:translation initiation factor 2B subunit (eIF-2B alpha/beta/delta family)